MTNSEADLPFVYGKEFKYTLSTPYSVFKGDGVTLGKAKEFHSDLNENASYASF